MSVILLLHGKTPFHQSVKYIDKTLIIRHYKTSNYPKNLLLANVIFCIFKVTKLCHKPFYTYYLYASLSQ